MISRRRLSIGIGIVLLLLLSGLLTWKWLILSEPERAYERLRLGMTLEELESAIGREAGDWRNIGFDIEPVRVFGVPYVDLWPHIRKEVWIWEHQAICVFFDDDGKAEGIYLLKLNYVARPTFFDRMRKLLGI